MTPRPPLLGAWRRSPTPYRVGSHRFDAMGPPILYDTLRLCSGAAHAAICRRIVDNRVVLSWPLGDADLVIGQLISGPLGGPDET